VRLTFGINLELLKMISLRDLKLSNNRLTVTNEVFWRAGLSISTDGKCPQQKEIENHFNFSIVLCFDNKVIMEFDHAADISMFCLRYI